MGFEAHASAVHGFALFAGEKVSIETTSLLGLVARATGFQIFPFGAGGAFLSPAQDIDWAWS